MAIEVILLIMCVSLILLFIFFIMNIIFILNKEWIKAKFNTRIISIYIKYKTILRKMALIYAPMFRIICSHGLYWLIINQIPSEYLNLDLIKEGPIYNIFLLTEHL
jgi:hypothetical protein